MLRVVQLAQCRQFFDDASQLRGKDLVAAVVGERFIDKRGDISCCVGRSASVPSV